MDYFDSDYLDDEDLVELPCQFCEALFLKPFLTIHQGDCEFNPDNMLLLNDDKEVEKDLINLVETCNFKEDTDISIIEEKSIKRALSTDFSKEVETASKDKNEKEEIPDSVILSEDKLSGNQTVFTFGSSSSSEKNVKEENNDFKPVFPLNGCETRSRKIHNILPDSDDEDGESLEEFWRKADIKLSQRLATLDKNKLDGKI